MNERFAAIYLFLMYAAGIVSGLPIGYALAILNITD